MIAMDVDCEPDDEHGIQMTKRRTKTGCLSKWNDELYKTCFEQSSACRKRRIKCDEERPICNNCIKSKRDCIGYTHSLTHKQYNHLKPHAVSVLDTTVGHQAAHDHPIDMTTRDNTIWRHAIPPPRQYQTTNPARKITTDDTKADGTQAHVTAPIENQTDSSVHFWRQSLPDGNFADHIRHSIYDTVIDPRPLHGPVEAMRAGLRSDITGAKRAQELPLAILDGPGHNSLGFVQKSAARSYPQITQDLKDDSGHMPWVSEAEEDPDDPWDVEMDEGFSKLQTNQEFTEHESIAPTSRPLPGALSPVSLSGPSMELALKQRPFLNSPLLEERSQRIFKHFLAVTGPCMGLFDRPIYTAGTGPPSMTWAHEMPAMALESPALAHAILSVGALHMFKLNIGNENTAVKHFTCALRRVATAVGDPRQRLQISTLATVLLLAYYEVIAGDHSRWNLHLSGAVKLVMEHNYAAMMRAVGSMRPMARTNIAQSWPVGRSASAPQQIPIAEVPRQLLNDNDWNVDQKLITKLMGHEVDYDTQIQPQFPAEPAVANLSASNFHQWQVVTELYWFYARQDVFSSLLSGDPLLLPYAEWKFCPPRGPLNNPEQVHSTFDHLWLILARLADFGAKDRSRKQGVVQVQGGQWIPHPNFLGSTSPQATTTSGPTTQPQTMGESWRRPSANEGRTRSVKMPKPSAQSLNFYGMMPPATSPSRMPSSFSAMNEGLRGVSTSVSSNPESVQVPDLDSQTQQALQEHASITEAFDIFESQLGPEYQPLVSTEVQITTPFGPALQYKSHLIATMWAFYTMGRILLRRVHPHSPPAAMISAGFNAQNTHHYAETIGRICGGVFAQHSYLLQAGHVDHVLSGAAMELTFPLLFAAVQYRDAVQRGWTIGKLGEIAQVTGWQSATAVAAGCESMWERAGLMGRGPPYQRTMDRNHADQRLNGTYKFGQAYSPATSTSNAVDEHNSRFVTHDRGLINRYASTRAHWALGILSVEEDLRRMSLSTS